MTSFLKTEDVLFGLPIRGEKLYEQKVSVWITQLVYLMKKYNAIHISLTETKRIAVVDNNKEDI